MLQQSATVSGEIPDKTLGFKEWNIYYLELKSPKFNHSALAMKRNVRGLGSLRRMVLEIFPNKGHKEAIFPAFNK